MKMKLVATVFGVPVFANKSVQVIIDSKVIFADGAWCDVRSGAIGGEGVRIGKPIKKTTGRSGTIIADHGTVVVMGKRGSGNIVASRGGVIAESLSGSIIMTGGGASVVTGDGSVVVRQNRKSRW